MFIFTDTFPGKRRRDMHVIVDDSFTTNEDLISHIMEETRSPYKDKPSSNFDDIYDGLIECTWLENVRNMRIIHESLPNISDIHRYLDTLNVLDVEWEILPEFERYRDKYFKGPEREEHIIAYNAMDGIDVSRCVDSVVISPANLHPMKFDVYFKDSDKEFVINSLTEHSKDYRKRLYYDECGFIHIKY